MRHRIGLVLVGLALSGLVPGMAPAADLAYKAPVAPPVWSWTGFYAGLEAGAKFGNSTWTTTSTSDFPGTIVDASSPAKFDATSGRVGAYAGYNWQRQAWLVGVEADAAYASATAGQAGVPGCAILCFPFAPGPGIDTSSVKMGWDASLRGRVGYLVTPTLLLYGTGGIAWQSVQTSGFCQHSAADPVCSLAPGDPFDLQTNRTTLTGWTLGAGIEARVTGNWLLRGEYRYAGFGTFNGLLPFNSAGAPPGTDFVRYHLSLNTQTVTVGLAYKFDWTGPVVARY
jgi:outer membrane immunogenic protein